MFSRGVLQPKGQMKNGKFWFLNFGPLHDIPLTKIASDQTEPNTDFCLECSCLNTGVVMTPGYPKEKYGAPRVHIGG